MKKFCLIICFTAALCAAAAFTNPLRFHITANSDSSIDQSVKLAVRDEIIALTEDKMKDCDSIIEAERAFMAQSDEIERAANAILRDWGMEYSAKVTIADEKFPTRVYGNKIYPAGGYTAVRITLGSGNGHNWWCVLFPPLCLSAEEDAEYTSWIYELLFK